MREYGHRVNPLRLKISSGVKLKGKSPGASKVRKKVFDDKLAALRAAKD